MSEALSVGNFIKVLLDLILPLVTFWNGGNKNKPASDLAGANREIQPIETDFLSRDVNEMVFYLYPDGQNVSYKEILKLGDKDSVLRASHYNPKLSLILLIHGFMTDASDGFAQDVKNAFLQTNYGANIVVIDWGKLSTPTGPTPYIYYNLAAANVPPVANRTAEFIVFLKRIEALNSTADVQIIGFSLGAHVAGLAGKIVNSTLKTPLARVTGLDPASPAFQTNPPSKRLDKTDATFVDVYHTNQGVKGIIGLLGHVDFFPNGGGPFQPGCSNLTNFNDIFTGSCSHGRAYEYFVKSIIDPNIIACKCRQSLIKWPVTNFVNEQCKSNCMESTIFGQFCPTRYPC